MANEAAGRAPKTALVRTTALCKRYVQRASFSRKKFAVEALSGVELDVAPGCLTALVGGSGSGKSTLARCLAMLERPDSGEIWFEGQSISLGNSLQVAGLRPKIQLVFQDSAGGLNPRFWAGEIIGEPRKIKRRKPRIHRPRRILKYQLDLRP